MGKFFKIAVKDESSLVLTALAGGLGGGPGGLLHGAVSAPSGKKTKRSISEGVGGTAGALVGSIGGAKLLGVPRITLSEAGQLIKARKSTESVEKFMSSSAGKKFQEVIEFASKPGSTKKYLKLLGLLVAGGAAGAVGGRALAKATD